VLPTFAFSLNIWNASFVAFDVDLAIYKVRCFFVNYANRNIQNINIKVGNTEKTSKKRMADVW